MYPMFDFLMTWVNCYEDVWCQYKIIIVPVVTENIQTHKNIWIGLFEFRAIYLIQMLLLRPSLEGLNSNYGMK